MHQDAFEIISVEETKALADVSGGMSACEILLHWYVVIMGYFLDYANVDLQSYDIRMRLNLGGQFAFSIEAMYCNGMCNVRMRVT